jgi:tetratricopeptide (TPR) repeat protein
MFLLPAVIFSEPIDQPGDDPVLVVLKAYDETVAEFRKQENPSSATRMAHYQEWKEYFLKVVQENPQSEYTESAKIKLLGLSNGLGNFHESQTMLQGMIAHAGNPVEKIRWLNESGEVNRMRYWSTQNQNDAQKSLDVFEQAHALYLQLPPEAKNGELSGRQVVALCMAGDISKVFDNHVKSAMLFQSARELFQVSTDAAIYAVLVHCDLESIADQEMAEWIKGGKESKALICLAILSRLRPYRWPPSYYALKYASLRYENEPRGFQDFTSKWLDTNAFDERTPILMAHLGFSYFEHELYEQALPLYEILRDKHRDDFQSLEPDAFRDGGGGCYDRVLTDLATIYLRRGHIDEAEKLKNELKNLLPKSANVGILSNNIPKPELEFLLQQRSTRSLVLRVILAVTGLVLILLGVYLRWFVHGE